MMILTILNEAFEKDKTQKKLLEFLLYTHSTMVLKNAYFYTFLLDICMHENI